MILVHRSLAARATTVCKYLPSVARVPEHVTAACHDHKVILIVVQFIANCAFYRLVLFISIVLRLAWQFVAIFVLRSGVRTGLIPVIIVLLRHFILVLVKRNDRVNNWGRMNLILSVVPESVQIIFNLLKNID